MAGQRQRGAGAGQLVPLEGCHNFRDIGGYASVDGRTVRHGLVFRSDGLHELTRADVDHLREELGLRSVVDLRSPQEAAIDGVGPLVGHPVTYHHVPLFDRSARDSDAEVPSDLGELYLLMLRFAAERIGRVLSLMADAREPLVFHCAAGKDRTGVVAAVILGLLGVDEEQIVRDYALTALHLDRIVERLESSQSYREIWDSLPPETLHAEGRTMTTLLARVRERWGSMEGYASHAGVSPDHVDRLRGRLLA